MSNILDPAANLKKIRISTGYNAAATSIVLTTGEGTKLPDPATYGAYNLTWYNATSYSDPSDDPNVEIVRVTAKTSDTLTITRAQESTTATVKNISGATYKFIFAPTAKFRNDIETKLHDKPNYFVVGTNTTYPTDGTADDVQINLALAACHAAGGGIVHMKGDLYLASGSTLLVYSDTVLEGDGDSTVLHLPTGCAAGTLIQNADLVGGNTNIELRDFVFDGNHDNNDNNNAVWLFNFKYVTDLRVRNVTCRDHYYSDTDTDGLKYCFQVWFSNRVTFSGCHFYRATRPIVCRDCDEGSITNNVGNETYLRFIEVSNDWQNSLGTYSKNFVVTGNSVKTTYSGDGDNGDPYYFKCDNCTCANNVAEDFYRFGIRFVNSNAAYEQQNNKVIGNVLIAKSDSAYGNHGIICYRQRKISIIGNTVISPVQEGINAEFCSKGIIANNVIEESGEYGIGCYNYADNMTITGNTLIDCGDGTTYHGIFISDMTNSTVSNNTITDTNDAGSEETVNGIYGYDLTNVTINGNTINNPKTYGIYLNNDIVNVNLTGNNIRDAKGYGLYVNDGSNINVQANNIHNCGAGAESTGGMLFDGVKYLKIDNNMIRDKNAVGSKVTYDSIKTLGCTHYDILNNQLEYFGGEAFNRASGVTYDDYSHNQEFTNTSD